MIDPFAGKQLIRITLERHGIVFEFADGIYFEVNEEFLVKSGGSEVRVCPPERSGAIESLWRLLAASAVRSSFEGAISISLTGDDAIVVAESTGKKMRGALRFRDEDGNLIWQEF